MFNSPSTFLLHHYVMPYEMDLVTKYLEKDFSIPCFSSVSCVHYKGNMWRHKGAKLVLTKNPGDCERKKQEISATTCTTDPLCFSILISLTFITVRKERGQHFLWLLKRLHLMNFKFA